MVKWLPALLIIVLTLLNTVTSLGAAESGMIGDRTGKKKSISVTFKTDAKYGYWEENEEASGSSASRASSSNARKVTEKKVTFTKLQEDDEGNSFVTFADEETRDLVQEEVLSTIVKTSGDSELYVSGWYSTKDQLLINEDSKIQIYDNVTLTAQWRSPGQVKNEDNLPLEAAGLLPGQKLTLIFIPFLTASFTDRISV